MVNIPTVAWDETSPAGSANRNEGDDRIRELKTQIREVINVDHDFPSTGNGSTRGFHNKVTLSMQLSNPTPVASTIILYTKLVNTRPEIHYIDEDSNVVQLTATGNWVAGIKYEVRMFSGLTANIPTGWVICDGTNDTPNLTSKFIRGVSSIVSRPNGGTGGSDTHAHTVNGHTHSSTHKHGISVTTGNNSTVQGNIASGGTFGCAQDPHTHTIYADTQDQTITTSSTAPGTDTISNIPAYVALAFIMKT
jgi:hypothetical protein